MVFTKYVSKLFFIVQVFTQIQLKIRVWNTFYFLVLILATRLSTYSSGYITSTSVERTCIGRVMMS